MTVFWLVLVGFLAWLVWRQLREEPSSSRAPASVYDHYEERERPHMPDDVANGQLVLSEQQFVTNHPVPLVARVDQVFHTPHGLLVPVETKTRFAQRAYPYDQIELSVQAVVLKHSKQVRLSGAIASYGYVRVIAEGRAPAYVRVPLLSESEVVALYQRHQDLQADRSAPRPTTQPALCRRCPQVGRCPHPQAARP